MGWRVAKRLFEIVQRLFELLPRQAVHEVEVEVVEMLRRQFDGLAGFADIVNAPERGQMCWMEALDAERKAIHSGGAVSSKARGFRCAGIGFQRDFRFWSQRQAGPEGRKQGVDCLARKQTGRAAAKKHADYPAPPDQRQGGFQVGNQCGNVFALR